MRLLAALLLSLVIAYAISWFLSVHVSPEVTFWHEVVERRDSELGVIRVSREGEPVTLFTGGSSCAFSINASIIEAEIGMAALNLGLPIYAGGYYIVDQAMSRARHGDLLVLALEPDLFVHPDTRTGPTPLSLALAVRGGNANNAAGSSTFDRRVGVRSYLNEGRPGLRYLSTLGARFVTGRAYRYGSEDIRSGGRIETPRMVENLKPSHIALLGPIPESGRELLAVTAKAASLRGVNVVFTLPWYFADEDQVERAREHRAALLEEISEFLPVVDDGYLGCATERSWFSDTALHLSAEGSAIRSEALGRALAAWLEQEEAED